MLDGIIWSTAEASDHAPNPMSCLSVTPVLDRIHWANTKPMTRASTITPRDEPIDDMNNLREEDFRPATMKEFVTFLSNEKSVMGAPIMSTALVNSFSRGATHSVAISCRVPSSSANSSTMPTMAAAMTAMMFGRKAAQGLFFTET